MSGGGRWRVRLTAAAERDYRSILRWTSERFGTAQAHVYGEILTLAIQALTAGPQVTGSRPRNDIAHGLMTLHVARGGQRGRHLVLYRVGEASEPHTIDVLRLLHDSMDPRRHVEDPEEGEL